MTQNNNNQLTISYELLYLMQWLLENEPARLKKLIVQALQKGLKTEIQDAAKRKEFPNNEELHYSVVDFLALLEDLLQEAISEQTIKRVSERNLMPALNQIDDAECGSDIVKTSVERASLRLENHPQANAQELLFKELLKSWKPTKKTVVN